MVARNSVHLYYTHKSRAILQQQFTVIEWEEGAILFHWLLPASLYMRVSSETEFNFVVHVLFVVWRPQASLLSRVHSSKTEQRFI